ncbi:MAG TPA: RIP metalloprotease RseP [Gemmatimonadales bacterium]|jgi:regulator of sigma E protease
MNVLTTAGAFVLVLGVLIFVHELGHFLAAKSVGIAVLRFSLGFGPQTPLRFKRGETEYCVSWVPFGGYVKMAGLEDEGPARALEGPASAVPVPPERTFDHKSVWARAYVMLAGVTMNVIFAVAVYSALTFKYGVTVDPSTTIGSVDVKSLPMGAGPLETLKPGDRIIRINGDSMTGAAAIERAFLTSTETSLRIDVAGRPAPLLVAIPLSESNNRVAALRALGFWHEPVLGDVVPGQQADSGGLKTGDRVLRINGDSIPAWEVMVQRIEASAHDTLRMTLRRGGQTIEAKVMPRVELSPDSAGHRREMGKIGVAPFFPHTRYGVLGSVSEGARLAADNGGLVLLTLKGLLTLKISVKDLGGPVAIGRLSGEAARRGIETLLTLMALLSMNLAILNLLPIPVLDGGHIVFLIAEAVRGKPVSVQLRERLTTVGLVLLLMLMVLVTWNDVVR